MNWEEACRDSFSVEDILQHQERLLTKGETLIGQQVKMRGFLVVIDGRRPYEDEVVEDRNEYIFEAFMVQQLYEEDEVTRNRLANAEYSTPYIVSVEGDKYLYRRVDSAAVGETFFGSHLYSAHAAVMTGTLVPSSDRTVLLGIVPITTTILRSGTAAPRLTATF